MEMVDFEIDPGDKPAPGLLYVVQDFANAHLEEEPGGHRTRARETMAAWFERFRLLPPGYAWTAAERGQMLQFRHALWSLLEAHHDTGAPGAHAIAALNRLAADAALRVEFEADGVASLRPMADGIERVIGEMLVIVFQAIRDGTWQRLKMCRADDCTWAFYDRSKNGSGAWCSMSGCGNRAKAKAYRERNKA